MLNFTFNKILLTIALFMLMVMIPACNYAPSNVLVLVTSDCGKSWRKIQTGDTIPKQKMNACGYATTLPNYPMQGKAEFLTQFQNNVLVKVQMAYDYQIEDPLLYIQNAKFLGRMNADTTGGGEANADSSGSSQYETAENVVIDVRLRELVTTSTVSQDIVKFNPSQFEDELFKKANEVLKSRGVILNSMTFVTLPEDQTRMAIDAATAMAVYDSKNMGELGRQLVIARAGATRVSVNGTDK